VYTAVSINTVSREIRQVASLHNRARRQFFSLPHSTPLSRPLKAGAPPVMINLVYIYHLYGWWVTAPSDKAEAALFAYSPSFLDGEPGWQRSNATDEWPQSWTIAVTIRSSKAQHLDLALISDH
jgi:hypothetical protein